MTIIVKIARCHGSTAESTSRLRDIETEPLSRAAVIVRNRWPVPVRHGSSAIVRSPREAMPSAPMSRGTDNPSLETSA